MNQNVHIALPLTMPDSAIVSVNPDVRLRSLTGETMGTSWQVQYVHGPDLDADHVARLINQLLSDLVDEMSHWKADSLLSRFNYSPAGRWFDLPQDFSHVIAAGLQIAALTDGAFDPTIGRMTARWGYGPPEWTAALADSDLEPLTAQSGWQRLGYDPANSRLRQPGDLWLDFSGIAKGYAVDALGGLLTSLGIKHYLVEIGGELLGRGVRPDFNPWWVDAETPPDVTLPILRIGLHDLAVATSGNYRRGDHNIDPRSGTPIANGVVSVSVLHTSAMVADAWATAISVLGPEQGLALADHHDIAAHIITRSGGTALEFLSANLVKMIDG